MMPVGELKPAVHSARLVNLSYSPSQALSHSARGAAFYLRLFWDHVTALCKCGIPLLYFNDTIIVAGMFYFIFSECRPSLIPREETVIKCEEAPPACQT